MDKGKEGHPQWTDDVLRRGLVSRIAFEVKRSPHLGPDDTRALNAFKEEYPEAQCFFLVPSKLPENYRGFPVLPLEEFLINLNPSRDLI